MTVVEAVRAVATDVSVIMLTSYSVSTIAGFLLIIAGVATVMRGQAPSSQRLQEPVAPAAVGA